MAARLFDQSHASEDCSSGIYVNSFRRVMLMVSRYKHRTFGIIP